MFLFPASPGWDGTIKFLTRTIIFHQISTKTGDIISHLTHLVHQNSRSKKFNLIVNHKKISLAPRILFLSASLGSLKLIYVF